MSKQSDKNRWSVRELQKQIILLNALGSYRRPDETPEETKAIVEMMNGLEEKVAQRIGKAVQWRGV